jgi:DNA-binding Lrp family transcriptional regulator
MINHQKSTYKRNGNNQVKNPSYTSIFPPKNKIDSLDMKIISLMITGLANKQISTRLKVPLSTIQRRTRRLVQWGVVTMKAEVNLELMGYKKGLIHVCIGHGNIDQIARTISTMDLIESIEIHIGNFDMIGNIIYNDSNQLLQTISDIKKLEGVEKIIWSEEVYNLKRDSNHPVTILLGRES